MNGVFNPHTVLLKKAIALDRFLSLLATKNCRQQKLSSKRYLNVAMADKNCHKNSPKDKLIPKSEQYPEKYDEKHKYLLIPKKLAQHLQYLYQQGKLIKYQQVIYQNPWINLFLPNSNSIRLSKLLT